MTYIPEDGHRRWAEEAQARPGGHKPPGGPPLVLICSNIIKHSIKNPQGVSAHLELCRIGSLA